MAAIREAMERFVGRYEQMAPPYSAKKHRGVRYYEMARRGEEVPEARKEVEIFEFEATGELADGRLPFRAGCSSGTYVRSLAHELGAALGCGAHLAALRRLQVGPFQLGEGARPRGARAPREPPANRSTRPGSTSTRSPCPSATWSPTPSRSGASSAARPC